MAKTKYEFGFFNGVYNTDDDAEASARRLSLTGGKKPILFYNHSYGLIPDLVEAYDQTMAEMPPATRRPNNGDLFNEFLNGDTGILKAVAEVNPEIMNAVRKFRSAIPEKERKAIVLTETMADYTEHNQQLKALLNRTHRAILIAHSQGNLFANHAYDQVGKERQKRIGIIHVAPPTAVLHGKYVLSNHDTVINLIRLSGRATTLPANVEIPLLNIDSWLSGHGFVEVYLNPGLKPYSIIVDDINNEEAKAGPVGLYGSFHGTTTGQREGMFGEPKPISGSGVITYPGNGAHSVDSTKTCKSQTTVNNDMTFQTHVKKPLTGYVICVNMTGDISIVSDDPFVIKSNQQSSRDAPIAVKTTSLMYCDSGVDK